MLTLLQDRDLPIDLALRAGDLCASKAVKPECSLSCMRTSPTQLAGKSPSEMSGAWVKLYP